MKKVVEVSESIMVAMTDSEVKEAAMGLVELMNELDKTKSDWEFEKEQWKATIKDAENKVSQKRITIDRKAEMRKVDCKRIYDTESGTTHLEYNGKKYYERALSNSEADSLQPNLFDDADPCLETSKSSKSRRLNAVQASK